jgi:hypothetical protein
MATVETPLAVTVDPPLAVSVEGPAVSVEGPLAVSVEGPAVTAETPLAVPVQAPAVTVETPLAVPVQAPLAVSVEAAAEGNVIAWVNVREVPCTIGKGRYSTSIYGDQLDAGEDGTILIKGTKSGFGDGPMIRAMREGQDVLVTVHSGRGMTLPRPFGMGKAVGVRDGTNTRREFVVRLDDKFEASAQHAERDENDTGLCWKKRRFLADNGMVPLGNYCLMRSFVTVSKRPDAP